LLTQENNDLRSENNNLQNQIEETHEKIRELEASVESFLLLINENESQNKQQIQLL
jgi:hypothetical protein